MEIGPLINGSSEILSEYYKSRLFSLICDDELSNLKSSVFYCKFCFHHLFDNFSLAARVNELGNIFWCVSK